MKKSILFVFALLVSLTTFANASLVVYGSSYADNDYDFSGTGHIYADIDFTGTVSILSDNSNIYDDGQQITQVAFTVVKYDYSAADGIARTIEPFYEGPIVCYSLIVDPAITLTHIEYSILPTGSISEILGAVYTQGGGDRLIITANYDTIEIADIMFIPEPVSAAILAAGSLFAIRRRK